MARRSQCLILAALLGAGAGGCQCTNSPVTGSLLREGERCEYDDQCETDLCAAVPGGEKVCRRRCQAGCRPTEVCTSFGLYPNGDLRAGCVPEKPGLCAPCQEDADCPYVADLCLDLTGAFSCGRDCAWDGKCPDGYECTDAVDAAGGPAPKQCVPKSATCACVPATSGQKRSCQVENSYGLCRGEETCDGNTFSGCNARVPMPETCSGEDEDCNGSTDDGIPDQACGRGECQATAPGCQDGRVPLCTPGDPKPEECNGKDDDCDGETDEDFDLTAVDRCGACDVACAVAHGTPECREKACAVGSCEDGWADCDGRYDTGCEADLTGDAQNCGACSFVCELPEAVAACVGRQCAIDHCNPGHWDVNGEAVDGCEYPCFQTNGGTEVCDHIDNDCNGQTDDGVDTNTDVNNCGACGNLCVAPNGLPSCVNGGCVFVCNAGWADCEPTVPGCETNIAASTDNCGGCGQRCQPSNATGQCVGGNCTIAACATHWADCNTLVGDGCEVNTWTDPAHCTGCGQGCPAVAHGQSACLNGSCAVGACDAPWDDCNDSLSDGCEVDTSTSAAHCGACGNGCPGRPHADSACAASSCTIACQGSWLNCDNSDITGCESDGANDIHHCGSCLNDCPVPANANPTCANGACGFTCKAGFADCNHQASDGCEVDLSTDAANCGACGTSCPIRPHSTPVCDNGCGYACTAPYKDCNGAASDGCEINSWNNVSHCGTCGNVCPARLNATTTCSSGTCGFNCNSPWQNCNGSPTDGCESDSSIDPLHCGNCTTACPSRPNAGPACAGGSCGVACFAGWAECDSNLVNGCEKDIDTLTDPPPANCSGSTTDLGGVDGDQGSPGQTLTASGISEKVYKLRVREANSGCVYVSAMIELQSPPGVEYGLFLTNDGCGLNQSNYDPPAPGGVVSVCVCRQDGCWGEDSSIDVWAEVVYRGGTGCGNWNLNVVGNVYCQACEQ